MVEAEPAVLAGLGRLRLHRVPAIELGRQGEARLADLEPYVGPGNGTALRVRDRAGDLVGAAQGGEQ
jgi:hypothetical protein